MSYKDPAKRRAKLRENYAKDPAKYAARHKAWRDRNVQHMSNYRKVYRGPRGEAHRKDRYGLTADDVARMRAEQDGKCAICRLVPSGVGKMATLRVDHDHGTGRVRALLCHKCNAGLGMFGDDASLVHKAAMYLAHHAERKRESA